MMTVSVTNRRQTSCLVLCTQIHTYTPT
jgi:hypothetical protein